MADIGRSGCRNAGSSMPCPTFLLRTAAADDMDAALAVLEKSDIEQSAVRLALDPA